MNGLSEFTKVVWFGRNRSVLCSPPNEVSNYISKIFDFASNFFLEVGPNSSWKCRIFQNFKIGQLQGIIDYIFVFKCLWQVYVNTNWKSSFTSVQNFVPLSEERRAHKEIKVGRFSLTEGQTCRKWEKPGLAGETGFLELEVFFLGLNPVWLCWVGAGKSPISELVRHFFDRFLHIFVNISQTSRSILNSIASLYSSLQRLHSDSQIVAIFKHFEFCGFSHFDTYQTQTNCKFSQLSFSLLSSCQVASSSSDARFSKYRAIWMR